MSPGFVNPVEPPGIRGNREWIEVSRRHSTRHRGRGLIRAFALLVGCVATLHPAEAQTVRAVTFPGNSYLYNPNLAPPVQQSSVGYISFWYDAISISPGASQTIVASYTSGANQVIVLEAGIENAINRPPLPNGNHIFFSVTDGPGGTQILRAESDTAALYDGLPHHVLITWDSSLWVPSAGNHGQYFIAGFLDGNLIQWNAEFTRGGVSPALFSTPYFFNNLNNQWTVAGLINPTSGTVSDFYTGDLAELFVDLLVTPVPPLRSVAEVTQSGIYRPADLGPYCLNVFNRAPIICMRGNAQQFPMNLGGVTAFGVPQGYLAPTTAATDPFDKLP